MVFIFLLSSLISSKIVILLSSLSSSTGITFSGDSSEKGMNEFHHKSLPKADIFLDLDLWYR